jgi:hypothetical protein
MSSRLLAAVLLSLCALAGAGPASALDDAKPVYSCGLFVKDSDKDSEEPNSVNQETTSHPNMEIKGFFLKYDEAKAAEATTVNIVVKDLSTALPTGNTAINWTMKWVFNDTQYFVRAVADYSGSTAFEWGEYMPTGLTVGLSGSFVYQGTTPGKLFEGPDGVVQLVIPADIGGKVGSQISAIEVSANTGKSAVPVAVPSPSRGVAYENDGAATGKWTVAGCVPPAAAPVASLPSTPSTRPSETVGPTALPVKLTSTKVKAPKKKTLALKLSSTEKVTGLVAQLRSKSRTVAKGKLAQISGKGTLKLKLSKKLKKGKYTLDLVGKDAAGQQRSTSALLTVR